MKRFLLPDDIDESAIEVGIGRTDSLVFSPTEELIVTYLDTFDWRLFNAGLTLSEERGRRRNLVLLEPGCEPLVVATSSTPILAADLPDGHIADTVAPLLGIRALLPVGRARIERRHGRIDDDAGNMVTRVRLERVKVPASAGGADATIFTALKVGTAKALGGLLAAGGVEPLPMHDLEVAAAAAGLSPGGYSSKLAIPLDGAQPAAESLRTILTALLDTLEANVPGTIADFDTEFLHDFRVACRRTRSALTQLKGVLDPEATAPFNAEFKWLGSVTGPLRDLDVYLLEMPIYRAMLPHELAGDLDPLVKLIKTERAKAHRAVVRVLRSSRFDTLTKSWRECIETIAPAAGKATTGTTGELAARRISKAYRRIHKRGGRLGQDPPAEALHRLRIDAKKLRYLLEFFRSLYPKQEIAARIRELKALQDILGGLNDMAVQQDRLAAFADELHADPSVGAGAILTLGRLAGTLEQRQEGFRLAFHDAFVEFSSPTVRAAYDRLSGGKESR